MQVKKYEASSVLEALKEIKSDLGPDAIILSTQEAKSIPGMPKKFIVVAAVSETQLKKKEIAQKQLGDIYDKKVSLRSAHQQKMVIDNVIKNVENKIAQKKRTITSTPYIEINDGEALPTQASEVASASQGSQRVRQAARDAFKTSLSSQFFADQSAQLNHRRLQNMATEKKREVTAPTIDSVIRRLKTCGVENTLIDHIVHQIKRELGANVQRQALVDSWLAKWILAHTEVTEAMTGETLEIFVGPQGMGKTTALVKVAAHYTINEQKSVAIISTDLSKVGAVEQLRVYGRILNIPVYVASSEWDLQEKIQQLGHEYSSLLVDTPGISLGNIYELDFIRNLTSVETHKIKRIHLVLSALAKASDIGSIIKRYEVAQFDDVIVSNIDQTTQHGILLNMGQKMKMPFHSFGLGSDVIDGFEFATKERVLDLIFKLTKVNGEKGHGKLL
ncbi:MAG: hypothetical protein KDD33_02890 [Bdellovibrionales bacterium]|nr:hypothetical protein [Bdellovibrionales bacterium]